MLCDRTERSEARERRKERPQSFKSHQNNDVRLINKIRWKLYYKKMEKTNFDEHIKRILDRECQGRIFTSSGSFYTRLPEDISLRNILQIKKGYLSKRGEFILHILENRQGKDKKHFSDLCWRIQAWLEFQDIMNRSIDWESDNDPLNLSCHYCYYEATRILVEILESGINGYFNSSIALLRSFIELAVLQIYFKERDDNYNSFYKWFNGKSGHSPFKNTVNFIFSKDKNKKFVVVKERLLGEYSGTSIYVHKPRLDESFTIMRGSNTLEPSLESIFYWMFVTSMALQSAIWLYVITHPLCLFPVDLVKKFGYNWPEGIFFDRTNTMILKRALGDTDFEEFKRDLKDNQWVQDMLQFYNDQPSKSDEEIEETWQKLPSNKEKTLKNVKEEGKRIAQLKSESRAIFWAFTYLNPINEINDFSSSTPIDESILDYAKTKHLSKIQK